MHGKIETAIFPVAGMGTRFLPATKASPKEMLPIVDKPLIQFAVEEALTAGIKKLVFITNSSKRAIEDHFDSNVELELFLEKHNKLSLLKIVQDVLPKNVVAVYIRQPKPLGLGHAVLCAKPIVGDNPFAVILADDLIDGGGRSCLKDMVGLYKETGCSSVAVEKIPISDLDKYGIISLKVSEKILEVESIVEKPTPEQAPSNLAVIGRYILSEKIFDILESISPGKGGEIQLTDAIARLLQQEPILAHPFSGIRYDCGSKLGYLKAILAYGLKHPEVGKAFRLSIEALLEQAERV